jgi:hypothetical protein
MMYRILLCYDRYSFNIYNIIKTGWHSLKSTSLSLNGSWNIAKIQVLCDVMPCRGAFPDVSKDDTRALLRPKN